MGLRDELLAAARTRASDHGRSGPSIDDLLDVAVQRCDGDTRMTAFMGQRLTEQLPGDDSVHSPATEAELETLFQRAGALAVALDQSVQPAHVALVASLLTGDAAASFLPSVLFQKLAGPDVDRLAEMAADLDSAQQPAEVRAIRVRRLEHRYQLGDEMGVERPRCPRCHESLVDNIEVMSLDAAGGTVDVVACGTCGTALGVRN